MAATPNPVIHIGSNDGSTAIDAGKGFIFIAEDESNVIQLFDSRKSGNAIAQFDMGEKLELDGKEVDIEGACLSPSVSGRSYWIGSLSNNKNGKLRPDRDRLFATDKIGDGSGAKLVFVGFVSGLRSSLASWGDSLGYDFSSSMAKGIEPKRKDGFNVEGLEFGSDGKSLWIGLRAPLVGPRNDKALIVPLLDFESWFAAGSPTTPPRWGKPIELDLGGRGIRSLAKNANGDYLLVAGPVDSGKDFAIYQWDGDPKHPPRLRKADLTGLAPEGIVSFPKSLDGRILVQLLSDMGKDKNTRSDWVVLE